MRREIFILVLVLLGCTRVLAQLVVNVSAPMVTGSKAVIKMEMKNDLTNSVQSARATAFLLDEKGQRLGQVTKWVIGGAKEKASLAAGQNTTYNFVISSSGPITSTNLSAKVSFNRVVLADGKLIDVNKNVEIRK